MEACRVQGRGKDQRDAPQGQWPGAEAAAEPELDIVHDEIISPYGHRGEPN